MNIKFVILLFFGFANNILAWENLPQLPSGRRSQYFLLENDGGYKYGYDTGSGVFAKQNSDASNQVDGHFVYPGGNGKLIDIKYTAGVQGYVPEGASVPADSPSEKFRSVSWTSQAIPATEWKSTESDGSDGSYSFSYNTGDSSRSESADSAGNVQGRYSYQNEAGSHDLSYVAGADSGFQVTGGSLAAPYGISGAAATKAALPLSSAKWNAGTADSSNEAAGDGSYSFSYNTGDSSRSESADSAGNVQGRYSYQNEAGIHDLSYIAGADSGFQVTGGSLAAPNGISGAAATKAALPLSSAKWNAGTADSSNEAAGDGSYSFSYNTGDSSRSESADSAGNVQGRYSYQNEAGSHDLSYVAGADSGFQVTGGSLAAPYGISGAAATKAALPLSSAKWNAGAAESSNEADGDGSYSFSYNTGDSSRSESADSAGNVQGRYSYQNEAGSHDLSYIAGADSGFQVTGGSLAAPNGISGAAATKAALPLSSAKWNAGTAESSNEAAGDGSYSFSYNTGDSSRSESADSAGNVQGRFSYQNEAGSHDLAYKAGSSTGFIVTGGSLSKPNGLTDIARKSAQWRTNTLPRTTTWNTASSVGQSAKFSLGNVIVHKYLGNGRKVGYIFDTQH